MPKRLKNTLISLNLLPRASGEHYIIDSEHWDIASLLIKPGANHE